MADAVTTEADRLRQRFGTPKDTTVAKVKPFLPEQVKAFIRQSPFLVMATSNGAGFCDASPKGGKPGFVRILDDQHLVIPDVAGNKLFQSYLNMAENPHVGLVFFISGSNDTVRVNGRVTFVDKGELARLNIQLSLNNPDDNSTNIQGLLVEVEEAYTHCPRALKFADVWNVVNIEARKLAAQRPASVQPK